MKEFEWGIVGGGIAGISVSEILTREGHEVVLIEKNKKLASETTRDFHEWIHTGALYTLIPDRLITLKFVIGAIDDLIEYYSSYERMNLVPTSSGLDINIGSNQNWFSPNYINFRYRLKRRKLVLPWLFGVARSICINEKLHQHDWLRRRAGELDPIKKDLWKNAIKMIPDLIKSNKKFYNLKTTDFTTNSRVLLRDIVTTAIENSLHVSLGNKVMNYEKINSNKYIIHGESESFKVKNMVICAGDSTTKFVDGRIKTSYAPIAIVNGINPNTDSFVELDYFPKNCINILTKDDDIALIGGISLSDKEKCDEYIEYVIKKHKQLNPDLRLIKKYIGRKTEMIFQNQDRNYLFHIKRIHHDQNLWYILPGKFTLGFSLAPEFYRRVYNKNPKKHFKTFTDTGSYSKIVADTVWHDSIN